MQFLRRGESARRVVGQQGRYLQRYPSVHAIGPVVNGSEESGGLGEIFQRQIEKERLARFSFCQTRADRKIVSTAVLDGVIEDRWIRSEPGHRQLVDIALQCAGVQQVACNIVEPETLAQVVEQLGCSHFITS